MKKETIIKVLDRYCKSLESMRLQAISDNELKDVNQYQFDINALKQAKKMVRYGKE